MRRIVVFTIVASALLLGCGRSDETGSAETSTTPTEKPIAAASHVRPLDKRKGADILAAAGVNFGFPHVFHYDIMDKSRSGTPRHRVLVEVLGEDFETAARDFDASLVALGYKKISDANNNGRIEQVFSRKGKPTYYLLMQPKGRGPALRDPDAVGSIHVMWNAR
jgi:hypothetical protein